MNSTRAREVEMYKSRKRVIATALLLWILIVTCNLPAETATPVPPNLSSDDIANTAAARALTAQASLVVPVTGATSTMVPTATPVPTGTQCTAMVTANTNANVRSGPDILYDAIGSLPAGGTAQVAGRNDANTWWYIKFAGGYGGYAWIAGSVVTPACIPPVVQVVAAPPLPTAPPPTKTEMVSIPPLLIVTLRVFPRGDIVLQDVFLSTNGEVIARVAVDPTSSLSGNVSYKVWVDGSLKTKITRALPTGSMAYWSGVFISGTHNVKVSVDTDNIYNETSEDNNSWQGNLTH